MNPHTAASCGIPTQSPLPPPRINVLDENFPNKKKLISLLKQAAQLEHCLLNAYIYAACTLKCTPEEFETINGQPNYRKAIQFERVRKWKRYILSTAKEEMIHLHYVQLLLRALGERAYFILPERSERDGHGWVFKDWNPYVAAGDHSEVVVPLEPFSADVIQQFAMYESTDSLLDTAEPQTGEGMPPYRYSQRAMEIFRKLNQIETEVFIETATLWMSDEEQKVAIPNLRDIIKNLPANKDLGVARLMTASVDIEEMRKHFSFRFQSIADFYNRGVLPLFEEAFRDKQVPYTNINVNNELQEDIPQEGLLGIGANFRNDHFKKMAGYNMVQPIGSFAAVKRIVKEIVEEGEGGPSFEKEANTMIAYFDNEPKEANDFYNPKNFVRIVKQMSGLPGITVDGIPPEVQKSVNDIQVFRESHLFRFIVIMMQLEEEQQLSKPTGGGSSSSASDAIGFQPTRRPLNLASDGASNANGNLKMLRDTLPGQFNAVYLCVCIWLSRMYEINLWEADKDRRKGITSLATWPLMSMGVRPFLELAAFFLEDPSTLFDIKRSSIPDNFIEAQQLCELWEREERSMEIIDKIDFLVVRVLKAVSEWADSYRNLVENSKADVLVNNPVEKMIICQRLKCLIRLKEFEQQFLYRKAGGDSDAAPSQVTSAYAQDAPDKLEFSESYPDPTNSQPNAFEDTFVLRLMFAGYNTVQLATDPDPPTDEVGVTGTLMYHPADKGGAGQEKYRWMDRSVLWQPKNSPHAITRGPENVVPPGGVKLVGANLMVTSTANPNKDGHFCANGTYQSVGVMNSTGAVQTSGQQNVPSVSGLTSIASSTASGRKVNFNLLPKSYGLLPYQKEYPYLNGDNHLVWKDGEPIDPFIFDISFEGDNAPIARREIFNNGSEKLMEMTPMQRALSNRGPVGFGGMSSIPSWALDGVNYQPLSDISSTGDKGAYLRTRAEGLGAALNEYFSSDRAAEQASDDNAPTIELSTYEVVDVDNIISYAGRLHDLATYPNAYGWMVTLNYGHCISGAHWQTPEKSEQLLDQLFYGKLGIAKPSKVFSITKPTATGPVFQMPANQRWISSYTLGAMDTDSMQSLAYGQVFIPLTVKTGTQDEMALNRKWKLYLTKKSAAPITSFTEPFYGQSKMDPDNRGRTMIIGGVTYAESPLTTTLAECYFSSTASTPTGQVNLYPMITITPDPSTLSDAPTECTVALTGVKLFPGRENFVATVVSYMAYADAVADGLMKRFGPRDLGM